MQHIHAFYWLARQGRNHIAFLQSGFLRRTSGLSRKHQRTRSSLKFIVPRNNLVQRRSLRLHANIAAPNPAKPDQFAGNKLRRINGNRKTQPLRRQDGCGVHAHNFALGIHQRPARVSWIEGCIGLDHVFYQAS
jgi:hypothetical protein